MKVRLARRFDIAAMHRLRLSVLENRLMDPGMISETDYRLYVDALCAWVAEINGSIAGFGALDTVEARIWALFVDPGCQGVGAGRALLTKMVACARKRQLARLSLRTEKGTRAEEFYKRAGWIEVGVTDDNDVCLERAL